METAEELRELHKKAFGKLQRECEHSKISDWREEWWAPAHSTGFQVKVCEICEKVMSRRTGCRKCGNPTEDYINGNGTHSRPIGSYYCPDCFERTEKEIKEDEEHEKRLHEFIARKWKNIKKEVPNYVRE